MTLRGGGARSRRAGRAAGRHWEFVLLCLEAIVSRRVAWSGLESCWWSGGGLFRKPLQVGLEGIYPTPSRPHHETGPPVPCLSRKVWNHLNSIQPSPPLLAQSLQAQWKRGWCSESAQKSTGSQPLTLQQCFKPPTNPHTCLLKPGQVLWKAFFVLPAVARTQKKQQRAEEKNINLDKWWLNAPPPLLPVPDQTVQKRSYMYYHWLSVSWRPDIAG